MPLPQPQAERIISTHFFGFARSIDRVKARHIIASLNSNHSAAGGGPYHWRTLLQPSAPHAAAGDRALRQDLPAGAPLLH